MALPALREPDPLEEPDPPPVASVRTDPERIERAAILTPISRVAAYLQAHLGQRVTAYLSGLRDPGMVGRWAACKSRPRELPSLRLRCAFQAAQLLTKAYGDETARAWFFGANIQLDDRAPAYVLRHGETPDELRGILPAAREFVGRAMV